VKTLAELALWEDRLLATVESFDGSIDARRVTLERSGVPHEYAAVLTAYLDLLADPASHHEALRRACFLAWYASAEPSVFTGLSAITVAQQQQTVALLEAAFASREQEADDELRAMLGWYAQVSGGLSFLDPVAHPMLAHFLTSLETLNDRDPAWRPLITEGRGQMGRYWASLRPDA